MSFVEAALTVLQSAKPPLHYRDITQQALGQALIQTDGRTRYILLRAELLHAAKLHLETDPADFALVLCSHQSSVADVLGHRRRKQVNFLLARRMS